MIAVKSRGIKHWLIPIADPAHPQAVPRTLGFTRKEIEAVNAE